MNTNNYVKCPRCGQYTLKAFYQYNLIFVYCANCQNLKNRSSTV